MKCHVCGGPLERLGDRPGGSYALCGGCRSVVLLDPPSAEELDRLYREEYRSSDHWCGEPAADTTRRAPVDRFLRDIIRSLHPEEDPRLVVEIGAAWGALGRMLTEAGIPYVGFELSEEMAAHGRSTGVDLRTGDLAAVPDDMEARTIVLIAVYEHLRDQQGTLESLRAKLPDDGAIVMLVPTPGIPRLVGRTMRALGMSHRLPSLAGMLAAPWHLSLTSLEGLRTQAARADLRVEQVRPAPSGDDRGVAGGLQKTANLVATIGHATFGERWPLVLSHLVVLRPA